MDEPMELSVAREALVSIDDDVVRVRMIEPIAPLREVEVSVPAGPSGARVLLPAVTGWASGGTCELYVRRDRRAAVRVVPAPGEVEVHLEDEPVTLVDLSATGLCFEVALPEEFVTGRFQVLLPGEVWPLILAACVRHRTRVGPDRVRYGVEFDRGRTRCFDEQVQRLATWIDGHRASSRLQVASGHERRGDPAAGRSLQRRGGRPPC